MLLGAAEQLTTGVGWAIAAEQNSDQRIRMEQGTGCQAACNAILRMEARLEATCKLRDVAGAGLVTLEAPDCMGKEELQKNSPHVRGFFWNRVRN